MSFLSLQMQLLYEQLGHRRIPGEHLSSKKMDLTLLNTEIKPEETVKQVSPRLRTFVHFGVSVCAVSKKTN